VALESINTITAQCEAHSPSLVRFAQQFGYSGFRSCRRCSRRTVGHGNLGFLRDLVVRDIATLHRLLERVSEE